MYSADNEGKTTWFLVFRNSELDGWWKVFCRDGFQHVFLFAQHGDNVVSLDPTNARLNIRIAYNASADNLAKMFAQEEGTTVIKVSNIQKQFVFPPVCMYCVAVAKYALGIPAWRGFTPYGLFQYLVKKNGAEIIDFT